MKTKTLAFLIVALTLIILFYTGPGEVVERRPSMGQLQGPLFFYFIGLMFLLSYFFEKKFFLFKALIFVCVHLSWPSSRRWAIVYFACFWVAGTIILSENYLFS